MGEMKLSPLAWAAGVLDMTLRIQLRRVGGDSSVTSVRMYARVPFDVATRLVSVLGGVYSGGHWYVPARRQQDTMRFILPHLVHTALVDEIREALKFRITSPRRRVGWKVSPEVRKFREGIAARKD